MSSTASTDPELDLVDVDAAPAPPPARSANDLYDGTQHRSLLVRLGSEFAGTFIVVLAILGTAAYAFIFSQVGPLAAALAGGLAYLAVLTVLGPVSGGHANPAVSLGAAITGRLSWADLVPYWVAQVAGAIGAAGIVRLLVPDTLLPLLQEASGESFFLTLANGYGANSPLATVSGGQATSSLAHVLIIEAIVSAVLVGVVVAALRRRSALAPVAIGLTYTVVILIASPISNAGVNPARSLGAAIFAESSALGQVWLFWVAPLLGAAIAGLIATLLESPSEDELFEDDEEYEEEEEGEEDLWEASDPQELDRADVAAAVVTSSEHTVQLDADGNEIEPEAEPELQEPIVAAEPADPTVIADHAPVPSQGVEPEVADAETAVDERAEPAAREDVDPATGEDTDRKD